MYRLIIAYLNIYIIWGSTYYFMKLAVKSMPVLYIIGVRFFLGGAILMPVVLVFRRFKISINLKEIISSCVIGILLFIGGTGLVTLALNRVDSYIAALIVGAMPIIVVVFDKLLINKKITKSSLIGILFGILGLAVLLYDGKKITINKEIIFILIGITMWALGTSLSKKLPLPKDNFLNTAIQISAAGFISLLISQFIIPFSSFNISLVAKESIFALLYLSIFGLFAVISYHYLLKHEPNERVVSYTFVNPLLAIFIGIVFGKEKAVIGLIPGSLLIGLSLLMIFYWETRDVKRGPLLIKSYEKK